MGFRSTALYQCLISDVSSHLSSEQLKYVAARQDWWPDASPEQVACCQLLLSIDKKLVESIAEDADQRALDKFLRVNEQAGLWALKLESSADEELFGTFKRVLDDFFHPGGDLLLSSYQEILDHARMGPGASLGARGNDFYTKLFSSRLTSTSEELYNMYSRYCEADPRWEAAEVLRANIYGKLQIVEGNRLSFVLKTNEISRTICTEPSLNMFYQLGLEHVLLTRNRTFFGVDLENQQFRNRELARLGSIAGGWSTIDLTSASDSISMRMLEASLPGWFLDVLKLLRSPVSRLPNGSVVPLNMISTMGNGYTFALQTILFSAVVRACFLCCGASQYHSADDHTEKNWGVNGDDIVVPTRVSRSVIRLLTLLGFEVNARKTFVEGLFRESCGGDFFKGRSVRGVYFKDLSSPEARFVAINLLNDWSYRTGINLSCTVQYLMATTRRQLVPLWENMDAGIRIHPGLMLDHERVCSDTGSFLYRRSSRRAATLRIDGLRVRTPAGQRRRIYNPWGLQLCFLRGDVVDGRIGVRHDTGPYVTKQAVALNWEYPPYDHDLVYAPEGRGGPKRVDWSCYNKAELMTRLWLNFFG